jgi:hypothetical protein
MLHGGFAIVTTAITAWLVGRSLRPLQDLCQWVSTSPPQPYPLHRLPKEVKQIGQSWNQLLMDYGNVKQQQRRFINDVSHELRSPLSLVYGYLQRTLKRSPDLSAAQQEAIAMATSEAERMRLILQNLLELIRSESSSPVVAQEPILLNEVVRDVVEMIAKFEQRSIQLDLPSTAIRVQSNRDAWMQLLHHLIQNAIQNSEDTSPIVVKLMHLHDKAVIQVIDQGCGIAPNQQQAVFEPFYRVDAARDRDRGGSGLGLAIVKSLVEQMGGTITLDSALGEGSTFGLAVPLGGRA